MSKTKKKIKQTQMKGMEKPQQHATKRGSKGKKRGWRYGRIVNRKRR
jgi:hypothetical protein